MPCITEQEKRKVLWVKNIFLAFLWLFKEHNTSWFLSHAINILEKKVTYFIIFAVRRKKMARTNHVTDK